jgi:hypothetical protein
MPRKDLVNSPVSRAALLEPAISLSVSAVVYLIAQNIDRRQTLVVYQCPSHIFCIKDCPHGLSESQLKQLILSW